MQHLTLARRDTAWSCFMSLHFMVADIINQRDSWRWLQPWWHAASESYRDWWNQELLLTLDVALQHILPMAQNVCWASRSFLVQVQGCIPHASTPRIITPSGPQTLSRIALQHVLFGLLTQNWMAHRVKFTFRHLSPVGINLYLKLLARDICRMSATCKASRRFFRIIRSSEIDFSASLPEFQRLFFSIVARDRPPCMSPAMLP